MDEIQKPNNCTALVVQDERGQILEAKKLADSNSISHERLRQARIKFNLSCTLIAISASLCFTGVGLFWLGKISEDTALNTINLLSRIGFFYGSQLIDSAQHQLNEATKGRKRK
jgi:hypothetical protein